MCIVILTIARMRGCRHFRLGKGGGWGGGGGGLTTILGSSCFSWEVSTSISMETYEPRNMISNNVAF